MFRGEIIKSACDHAVKSYPNESCGYIVEAGYLPMENISQTPKKSFRIADDEWVKTEAAHGPILGVIHSHPDGPMCPTYSDMESQIATGVPWGIIVCDKTTAAIPFWWGDKVHLNDPLNERKFIHGVTDCFEAARGWFWQKKGFYIPNSPREYGWWANGYSGPGRNVYEDGLGSLKGFERVKDTKYEIGDVALINIHSERLNHAMVYIGNGTIYHHLIGRLSKTEPASPWLGPRATFHLRFVGDA